MRTMLDALREDAQIIPVPIRADLVVFIHGLPADLTTAEAAKVANVVMAFVSPSPTERGGQ